VRYYSIVGEKDETRMTQSTDRMTRCECHEVPFSKVIEVADATGIEDFGTLCALSRCGQTCTACHCDLKRTLAEHAAEVRAEALLVVR